MIKYIIFDFDDTLSDFQLAKEIAKNEITPFLEEQGVTTVDYWKTYEDLFEETFARYVNHELTVDEYRIMRFEHHGISKENAAKFNEIYLQKVHDAILFDDVKPTLQRLRSRGYKLYIFSNGPPVSQRKKIVNSGVAEYMDDIFISSEIGAGKPHEEAYAIVISKINAATNEIMMIGDSFENDCLAAERAGITPVQVNRHNKTITNYKNQINSLTEIDSYLP